jgi:hypothetical protein
MRQQARNLCMMENEPPGNIRFVIHDRDASFLPFDDMLKSDGIEVIKTPPATPQCNAFAERFVRECRETLDNLILVGESHLQHALNAITTSTDRIRDSATRSRSNTNIPTNPHRRTR